MSDQKNTILAIVLSALVLIGWQIYFGLPQMEKQKQIQQQQQHQQAQEPHQPSAATQPPAGAPAQQTGAPAVPGAAPQAPGQPGAVAPQTVSREAALAASPRVRIDTPSLSGSIALKGARIDDLSLIKYRETVDPNSPAIVLLDAVGQPASVLCRIRLGGGGGYDGKDAGRGHAVATTGFRRADGRTSGHAGLRQRRRPRVPPHASPWTTNTSSPSRTRS